MTAAPIPLADQIRCVERELAMRRGVYANKVRNRRMTQAEADMEIARLTAVLATIREAPAAVRELLRDLCSQFPGQAHAVAALGMGDSSIEKGRAFLARLGEATP